MSSDPIRSGTTYSYILVSSAEQERSGAIRLQISLRDAWLCHPEAFRDVTEPLPAEPEPPAVEVEEVNPPAPNSRATTLADLRVNPSVEVAARVTRGISAAQLRRIEVDWKPARVALAAAVRAGGGDLENTHWDWNQKVERVEQGNLVAFAIECDSQVQGLMAVPAQPRWSILSTGSHVIYVDYLEMAPWNHPDPCSG
jgi:hypothetical protein